MFLFDKIKLGNKIKLEKPLNQLIFIIGGLLVLGVSFSAGYFLSSRNSDNKPALTQPKSTESRQLSGIGRTGENGSEGIADEKDDGKTAVPGKMNWPGQGVVQAGVGFAYSETFGDFRYHQGIDIIMPVGTPVRASAAGICRLDSKIAEGDTLIISHGNGLETQYRGLAIEKALVDKKVPAGEVVGTIAGSPADENTMAPHLHFAVYQRGKAQDPMKWLAGN